MYLMPHIFGNSSSLFLVAVKQTGLYTMVTRAIQDARYVGSSRLIRVRVHTRGKASCAEISFPR